MTAFLDGDVDEWFASYAGRSMNVVPLCKSQKRSADDDVVVDLDSVPASPAPVDVPIEQPRKRMAARISEMATKEVLAVRSACVLFYLTAAQYQYPARVLTKKVTPRKRKSPKAVVATPTPPPPPQPEPAPVVRTLAAWMRQPQAWRRCSECWYGRSRNELPRNGLVHTLFAYGELFSRLYELYSGPFSKQESQAHLPDSEPMARLREIVAEMDVKWEDRCDGLRLPFDRAHRDVDRRAAPFRNDENLPAPLVDGNVRAALNTSMQLILCMGFPNIKAVTVGRFVSLVVLPTLVYLHERDLRRDVNGEQHTLLELQREYEAGATTDVLFRMIPTTGVAALAAACPEFAARQAQPWTYMREDAGADMGVLSSLTSLHSELTEQGALHVDAVEGRVCTILRRAPRDDDAAGTEYVWPHAFAVSHQYETKMCKNNGHWQVTLVRGAPLVVDVVPKTPEPPPYSPCPGFEDESKFASSSGGGDDEDEQKNAVAPLPTEAATTAPAGDVCDASHLMDSLLTPDELARFEDFSRSPPPPRKSQLVACCTDGFCVDESPFARGLIDFDADWRTRPAGDDWLTPYNNYTLD